MGLCIGTAKCSPNAFVNTAWLVAPVLTSRRRHGLPRARSLATNPGWPSWPPIADASTPRPYHTAFGIIVNSVRVGLPWPLGRDCPAIVCEFGVCHRPQSSVAHGEEPRAAP